MNHSGKLTVKVLPRPNSLAHSTVPRCDSAIQRTMARPSPKPPSWRFDADATNTRLIMTGRYENLRTEDLQAVYQRLYLSAQAGRISGSLKIRRNLRRAHRCRRPCKALQVARFQLRLRRVLIPGQPEAPEPLQP